MAGGPVHPAAVWPVVPPRPARPERAAGSSQAGVWRERYAAAGRPSAKAPPSRVHAMNTLAPGNREFKGRKEENVIWLPTRHIGGYSRLIAARQACRGPGIPISSAWMRLKASLP